MDLVVVGGGPAGLLVATRCAEVGLDVLVLEEHAVVGEPTHCTGILSLETAGLVKIPDAIVLNRLRRARLRSPAGRTYDVDWDGGDRETILVVDRAALDRQLAAQAAEAGVTIRTGARAHGVAVGARGVEIAVDDEVIRAQACVLACGVSYRLHRQLGLGLPRALLHTAQVETPARADGPVEIHFGRAVAPAGFAWLVPVQRGEQQRVKVGLLADRNALAAMRAFLDRAEVQRRVEPSEARAITRLLPLGAVERTYGERLLVVGDAGGFTKPTTGGGIFYGLLTGALAAETLVEAFQRGRLDAGFLSGYERRWKTRLGPELRVATWLRQLVTRFSDAEIEIVLRLLLREEVRALVQRTARFNWHAEVIVALVRQQGLARLLFQALLR